MTRSLVLLVLLGGFSRVATAAPSEPQKPRIEFGTDHVAVSNLTPGGALVLVSRGRGSERGLITQYRQARVLQDEDRDGVVRFTDGKLIPQRSVWVAVDLQSGEYSSGAPAGFSYLERPLAPALWKDAENEIAALRQDLPRLSAFVVRPKGGAWLIDAGDGGPNDRDGESNGRLEVSFEDTLLIGGRERGPKHLRNGDLVIAIDPAHLDLFTVEVGK